MNLKPCSCGGVPVLQTRFAMTPKDHFLQWLRHQRDPDNPMFYRDVYHVLVEDEHRYDVRVACPNCCKATEWDRRDLEQFVNHGPGDNRRVMKERDGNMTVVGERWNALI